MFLPKAAAAPSQLLQHGQDSVKTHAFLPCGSLGLSHIASERSLHVLDVNRGDVNLKPSKMWIYIWLVVWNIFFVFPYIGNNHPNSID